jgi:hypothetical protein
MLESMSPAGMPQFEALKRRRFAFHPAILNVEHNEWQARRTAGPEILVSNLKNDLEIWIPKRLVSAISDGDEPLATVSLLKEMEYRAGGLRPYERRVVEMPAGRQAPDGDLPERRGGAAGRSRGRLLAAVATAVLLGGLALVGLYRRGAPSGGDPAVLALTARDTYASVVHKLGPAAQERERPPYRALWYPRRSCYVILREARYIGALDSNWRAICHADARGSGDTLTLLRGLPRF